MGALREEMDRERNGEAMDTEAERKGEEERRVKREQVERVVAVVMDLE